MKFKLKYLTSKNVIQNFTIGRQPSSRRQSIRRGLACKRVFSLFAGSVACHPLQNSCFLNPFRVSLTVGGDLPRHFVCSKANGFSNPAHVHPSAREKNKKRGIQDCFLVRHYIHFFFSKAGEVRLAPTT